MFYQCPKCKKRWHYPLEKCPDCFSSLKEVLSERMKVIGTSRVVIPTILHPKVPYHVLVVEDDKGNRWAEKSLKEYKIGEEFRFEESDDKSAVAILRVKYDTDSAVGEIISLLGGIKITKETKILILPTLISPDHPYLAANTNPRFLDSLLRYLIQKGANSSHIKVAAQSFDEVPVEASAQKSQLLEVCLRNKIAPLDLAKSDFVKKEKDGLSFEVSKEVLESNLVINLPILKLDRKSQIKGALENTLKFLRKESYLSLKYLSDDSEIIRKLQEVLPSYLTIADCVNIQKSSGHVAFVGLILGGYNPFNIDRVFSEIAMIEKSPSHLKEIDVQKIPILGKKIGEVQYDIEKVGTS
ncbi:MAG: DUF362 domain-containing protein [Patescibacteria group bacterium]